MSKGSVKAASVARLLVLGLLIREIFTFWTGHPYDTEIWIRNAYYVSQGVNPYTYMPPVPGLSFAYLNTELPSVGYLPLWPLILAAIFRFYALFPATSRFVFYFLIKQPPVLGDLAIGYLLYSVTLRWGGKAEHATKTLRFWMLFPFAIIVSAIWGQFDALVASLLVLSLLVLGPGRRSALHGLGILLKFFPLIFVPYEGLRGTGRSRLAVALALVIPAAFTWLAFVIAGWDFLGISQMTTYSTHGNPGGLGYFAVVLPPAAPFLTAQGGALFLAIGVLWLAAISIAGFFATRLFSERTPRAVGQSFLLITAVFFLTRLGVNEQYLLYLLPLLLIDVTLWHPERRALFRLTWVLGLSYLLLDNLLLIRFLGPIFPGAVDFDFFLDNLSSISLARLISLQAVAILFSIHMVQLVVVLVRPRSDAVPWLWRLLRALRLRRPQQTGNPRTDR